MIAIPCHLSWKPSASSTSPPPVRTGHLSPTGRLGNPQPHYHRNQQYSIVALTNAAGTLVERYTYSAYGVIGIYDPSGAVRSSSTYANRYTYTGREYDADLNLYHFRARWYDPATGGFISRDPLGYVDGMSLYRGYFGLVGSDPTGLLVLLGDHWHHELAWKWIHYFQLAGYDINDPAYGWNLPDSEHRKIQGECDRFWNDFFEPHRQANTIPTREEIEDYLNSPVGKSLRERYKQYGTVATNRFNCSGRVLSKVTCEYHGLTYRKATFKDLPQCRVLHMPGQRNLCPIMGACGRENAPGIGDRLNKIGSLIDKLNHACAVKEFVIESGPCRDARDKVMNLLNNKLRVAGGEQNCKDFLLAVADWREKCGFESERAVILGLLPHCDGFPTFRGRPLGPPPTSSPGSATMTVDF